MGSEGNSRADTSQSSYSSPFAFFYLFNLIVGVGALTIPKAFNASGYVLGTGLLLTLCLMSYVTSTYVIEAMAAANAYCKAEERKRSYTYTARTSASNGDNTSSRLDPVSDLVQDRYHQVEDDDDASLLKLSMNSDSVDSEGHKALLLSESYRGESSFPLREDYEIVNKYEMGTMATLFYPTIGVVLYYVCICLYLLGDLTIYAVACPSSLADVVCGLAQYYGENNTNTSSSSSNSSDTYNPDCFAGLSRTQAYYIFLAVFIICVGPFSFLNMTKTKVLQVVTTVMRNLAFLLMFALAIQRIVAGPINTPSPVVFSGFPELFGISIYAFMCQHSIPGMVTPMRNKRWVLFLFAGDFAFIIVFYILLSYTGVFAFSASEMRELYSLDFFNPGQKTVLLVFGTYIALFPVFTLSTNFPIISITLRENLKALFKTAFERWLRGARFPVAVERVLFPLLAIIPPFAIAYATQQTDVLVSVTGSFPGVCVQYLIPVSLAFMGRYKINKKYGCYLNKHRSPLSHYVFLIAVLVWSGVSFILILVDLAINPPVIDPHPV